MPSAAENLDVIESTLKASLSQGKQLDQNVVSAAQRVLMHNIAFVPSSKPHSVQLSSLKSKYILLQPGKSSQAKKVDKPGSGQGGSRTSISADRPDENATDDTMNGSGSSSSSDPAMGDSLPSPRVVIYPPEHVKLEWRQMHRIGAGLVNLGNTCFFNSTLQCLTYTAPLVNYCFSEEHPKTCKQQNFCLMCELRRHIRSAFQHTGHAFKPQMMLQKLKMIAKHMRWGRQEDAHEFLRYLVDGLQRACLNGHVRLDKFSKETTVINQIFGGFLRSQVQCMKCSARSNTYDPFMDLSLDIKNVYTVEDALAKFVKAETLDSDNAYKCDKCQQKVPAQKRFSIHKTPNVLTLQLNRFDYHRMAGKINRHIQFPEKLNIRPYMSQKQGEPIYYYLYGVLIHSGFHCNSGHYYCYVKAPSKTWYLMNDSMVQTVPASRVFQAEAYLLFYNRVMPVGSQPPVKAPYIGPNSNGLVTANKFSGVNGSQSKLVKNHQITPIKPTGDVGVPVSRQMVSPTATVPPHAPSTSTSGAGSSLLQKHKKISFGIGNPKPFQQLQQQNLLQQKQNSTSASAGDGSNPRIVMQIKNGKVTTFEKSPDGKSKVVNGGLRRQSTLVPYDADSDSSDDQVPTSSRDQGSKSAENNTKQIKDVGKENRVSEKSAKVAQGSSFLPSTAATPSPKAEVSDHSDGPDKAGVKASGFDSTLSRRDLTLKLNRDSNAGVRKMCIDVASPSKVNATSSNWHVQMQDSAPSPSLGSCSSNNSNHSVNSTTEWHVQEMADSKSGFAAERKLQHAGWTVTASPVVERKDSAAGDSHSQTAHDRGKAFKHEKLKDSSLSEAACSRQVLVTESGDAVKSQHQSFSERVAQEKNSVVTPEGDAKVSKSGFAFFADKHSSFLEAKNQVSDSAQTSKVTESTKKEHLSCAKETAKAAKTGVNGHLFTSNSDKQPLLSKDNSPSEDKVLHKKHKKKKHKRGREHDESKFRYENLQESFSASDTSSRHKHKKKKRKSHSHENSDSDHRGKCRKDRSGSDSDNREKKRKVCHPVLDDEGCSSRKRRKSDSSDSEYMWEEKTKETLAAQLSQKPASVSEKTVPTQAWDHHVQDSLGQSRHDRKETPSKAAWDGTRRSNIFEELQKKTAVMSWNGGRSQADIEAEKEKRKQKKTWSDHYEEDIDRGKVKKVKNKHHDDNRNAFNFFQKLQNFQNEKNHDKEKWRDSHEAHHKHHTHHNNQMPPLNRSYSEQTAYRHGNGHHNRSNGHGSHHSFHRSYNHQSYQKRH